MPTSDSTIWTAVDDYFAGLLHPVDEPLERALAVSREAGLPDIQVAPNQGKLLHLLARMAGARRILEVGTLGGYSTIWLARALPDGGSLVTMEIDPHHAETARRNVAHAGLAAVVDVRVGPAAQSLERLTRDGVAPFDLVFIDADKPNNPTYFTYALQLTHPGSVIIVDNVVRGGAVADRSSADASVRGVHALTELVAGEPRVSATAIQTVGGKAYDGFLIARVNDTR